MTSEDRSYRTGQCRLAAPAMLALLALGGGAALVPSPASGQAANGQAEQEAIRLGEEFGVVVGPVDEDIQKELKLEKAVGVVVFEVIGGTPAELAGIKVRAVIKEIDKVEVKDMADFAKALKRVQKTCGYTIGTYEPADPNEQGVGGIINFHFVRCVSD
jgi:membrane-associated protease RseP (regulator of RpoE activity)